MWPVLLLLQKPSKKMTRVELYTSFFVQDRTNSNDPVRTSPNKTLTK